jgi:hypothetical protein
MRGGGVADMKTINRKCRNSEQDVLGDTHRCGESGKYYTDMYMYVRVKNPYF